MARTPTPLSATQIKQAKPADKEYSLADGKGKLDFNWKIVMAPNRMVGYVVVHELCHLKNHNHSPKF
jgi:predicted metal-dependent hydrolase